MRVGDGHPSSDWEQERKRFEGASGMRVVRHPYILVRWRMPEAYSSCKDIGPGWVLTIDEWREKGSFSFCWWEHSLGLTFLSQCPPSLGKGMT